MPESTNSDSVWLLHSLSQQKFLNDSYVKQYFQSTSRGAKKADKMIRQASLLFRKFPH